jgi:hypothetical protein
MSLDTTMGPVLAALETLWGTAFAADDTVQVIYGPRVTKTVTRQTILTIGTSIDFEPTVSTFGDAGQLEHEDELYDVACVIEATVTGTDQHAATGAALAAYATARRALAAAAPDETLGVSGVLWARVLGRGRVAPAVDVRTIQAGRSAYVTFAVRVQGVL